MIQENDRMHELRRIAQEQEALRNIATLIARGTPPSAIFDAVTKELGCLLDVQCSALVRYETGETGEPLIKVLSSWSAQGTPDVKVAVGTKWELPGTVSELVLRTKRSARRSYDTTRGLPLWNRLRNIRTGVGSPILVAGRLWGVSIILSSSPVPLPVDIETRMGHFVELAAIAIESAESRNELLSSRSRIVEAADAARLRIERDLHDGVQQHLISLGVDLRLVEGVVPDEYKDLKQQISRAAQVAVEIHEEVREIAHGVYPSALSRNGLQVALKTLATRSIIPARLNVCDAHGLDKSTEVTIYHIVSEALTNAAKHSGASEVLIDLAIRDSSLCLAVSDDGIGGADPCCGSGLIGLADRVGALGGTLEIISPAGKGTTLAIKLPITP